MTLITVRTFEKAIEAHMLMSKLESEGVVSYMFDEHTTAINPMYSIAAGGIRLKINESDKEKVKLILQEIDPIPAEAQESQECSQCKSENVMNYYKSMKGIKGVFNAMICSVFPDYYKSFYKCNACHFEFKINTDKKN
jgi:hypothetical protein